MNTKKLLGIILVVTFMLSPTQWVGQTHCVGGESSAVCADAVPVGESTLASLNSRTEEAFDDELSEYEWYSEIDELLSDLRSDEGSDAFLLSRVRDRLRQFRRRMQEEPKILRHPDVLFSLNTALNNIRERSSMNQVYQKNCLSDVRSLMKIICENSVLSQELMKGLGFYEGYNIGKADVTFYDADSTAYLREHFPDLMTIVRDSAKAQAFGLFLSMVRLAYPMYHIPARKGYDMLTPLEYAITSGEHISLGNGLYVAPISESFRRHIIFKKDATGEALDAIEIFIPGQNSENWVEYGAYYIDREPSVDANRFNIGCEMYKKYGYDCGFIKPHCLAEYPEVRTMMSYGEEYEHTGDQMFRMIIFDHSKQVQGRRLGNDAANEFNIVAEYVERIAERHPEIRSGTGRYTLADSILLQNLRTIQALLNERYEFGHDFHAGNFRVTLEGKVVAVGDFSTFVKSKNRASRKTLLNFPEKDHFMKGIHDLFDIDWVDHEPDYRALVERVMKEKIAPRAEWTDEAYLRSA